MTKQVHYKTDHSEEWHRIDYVRCAYTDVPTRTLIVEVWDDDQANSHAIEICDVVDYCTLIQMEEWPRSEVTEVAQTSERTES